MGDVATPHTKVQGGELSGVTVPTPSGDVAGFFGVPFGAPAVGSLRFQGPRPAAPWEGVLVADTIGPAPMQSKDGPFSGVVPGLGVADVSEDCLTVNVWTPAADGGQRPVLVWAYGGSFVIGGNSVPTYDGARLAAEQDVVVVALNYRVGAFGFLDLRNFGGDEIGATTNNGLRDQILALTWVRDNIAAFGGDPGRITAFGESAGAGSLLHVLGAPRPEGIVHRAILQSPGVDFTQSAEIGATVAKRLLDKAGVSTAAELAALTAEQILAAQDVVAMEMLLEVGAMVFHPVVDGDIVPETPSVGFANGRAADVDLVIGATTDEMRLFPDVRADTLGADEMARWLDGFLTSRLGGQPPQPGVAADLLAHYIDRHDGSSRAAGSDVWAAVQTDGAMRLPIERIAEAQSAHNPRTFLYQLAYQPHHATRDVGAFHAIDLPFVFDTFDSESAGPTWGEFLGIDDAGRELGRVIRTAWAAFAATGDPSSEATGKWPAYETTGRRAAMIFDTTSGVLDDPLGAERRWWAGLWDPTCRPAAVPI
jgi:para-nitrobenzyl esterase